MALALRDIFKKIKVTPVDCTIMLCVALVAILLFGFAAKGGDEPSVCVIEINGDEYARYDLLSLTEDKIIEIDNEYGRNTVVISRNGAAVTYSDCADGLEVKAGSIDSAGQSLICLPHRLIVRLEGKTRTDGVAW